MNDAAPAADPSDLVDSPVGLPYAVHVGIPYLQVIGALRSLRECRVAVRAEGDGWSAWSEAIGRHGNDPTTFHLVATTTNVARTLRVIVSLGIPLVARHAADDAPAAQVVAVVTDAHDPDVTIAEVTDEWLAQMATDWIRRERLSQVGGVARP